MVQGRHSTTIARHWPTFFDSYEKRKHFAKVHMKNAIVAVKFLCYVPAVFAHKHSLKKRPDGKIDDCVHFSPLPFCQR